MKIVTWNVNSVRIREDVLARYVKLHAPDVLCLQETKVPDAQFPHAIAENLGYDHVEISGQKSYNGVAVLSKTPLMRLPEWDVLGNGEKRHISVQLENGIALHNFYIPAGGDEPDASINPKFRDKLAFVQAMHDWSTKSVDAKSPVVILGDFNIAPYEHDVWSSKQLRKVVSHTPIEREALDNLRDSIGWIDAARHFVPETEKLYSWWSYRNKDWKKSNRGRRLDHIWVTPALKPRLKNLTITLEARDYERPSDHVPVMLELG
jgi:exodeoxyribonuclease-3